MLLECYRIVAYMLFIAIRIGAEILITMLLELAQKMQVDQQIWNVNTSRKDLA